MSMIGTLPLSKGAATSHGAGRHGQMTGDGAPAAPPAACRSASGRSGVHRHEINHGIMKFCFLGPAKEAHLNQRGVSSTASTGSLLALRRSDSQANAK